MFRVGGLGQLSSSQVILGVAFLMDFVGLFAYELPLVFYFTYEYLCLLSYELPPASVGGGIVVRRLQPNIKKAASIQKSFS